jgi:hypothetical protein
MRAVMSGDDPAGKPTTSFSGWLGQATGAGCEPGAANAGRTVNPGNNPAAKATAPDTRTNASRQQRVVRDASMHSSRNMNGKWLLRFI